MRCGSAARELVVGGGDRREERLAASRSRRSGASSRPCWRARPVGGSMRSSSVRSGVMPPVAKALSAAIALDAEAAAGALVGQRRVDEAVEQHPRARRRAAARAARRRAARARPRRAAPRRADRSAAPGSLTSSRMRSDSATPPGSRSSVTGRSRASSACSAVASVDLPAPSIPSIVMSRPRTTATVPFARRCCPAPSATRMPAPCSARRCRPAARRATPTSSAGPRAAASARSRARSRRRC